MKRVVIVGGTHGNELSGVYLYRLWQTPPASWKHYPFKIETYLANPGAVKANRRYLDQDLNRSFLNSDLANLELETYEAQRAKVLAREFQGAELLFDLHNTTANMGITLIFSQSDSLNDPLIQQLCLYLVQTHQVKIYNHPVPAETNPYLPSAAQREVTVEVGPLAHGTLNADVFFKTQAMMLDALEIVAQWQSGQAPAQQGDLIVYEHLDNVDYPRTEQGHLAGMVHPGLQDQDFCELKPGDPLFIDFDGKTIAYAGSESVWPVFINEQAYYEKHFAMSLCRKRVIRF